jgi:hypothetical protein
MLIFASGIGIPKKSQTGLEWETNGTTQWDDKLDHILQKSGEFCEANRVREAGFRPG